MESGITIERPEQATAICRCCDAAGDRVERYFHPDSLHEWIGHQPRRAGSHKIVTRRDESDAHD